MDMPGLGEESKPDFLEDEDLDELAHILTAENVDTSLIKGLVQSRYQAMGNRVEELRA